MRADCLTTAELQAKHVCGACGLSIGRRMLVSQAGLVREVVYCEECLDQMEALIANQAAGRAFVVSALASAGALAVCSLLWGLL